MKVAENGNIINGLKIYQRRYLGNKKRLLDFIESILQKENVVYKSFADIFAGTGVVADHFYQKANIIVNDILESNYLAYVAYFGKEPIRTDILREKINLYNSLNTEEIPENYFSINFSNTYFDHKNSLKIGYIREDIENLYLSNKLNGRERAYLVTSLIYALDKIANTVGHYDAYRKIAIPQKRLTLRELAISLSKNECRIFKNDANNIAKVIRADVVYIDPPYNSRQYSDAYHLLENVANWSKLPVTGVARKIDRSQIKSKYNMKTASESFSELISSIDAKYILVSYNDMQGSGNARSQSKITDLELISTLEKKGNVVVYEKPFKQFTAGKSNKSDLKERIFFCHVGNKTQKKPKTSAKTIIQNNFKYVKSPLNYSGGKYRLLPQLLKYFPNNINTFYDIFCGGANVGINANSNRIVCIDKNESVISLLSLIQKQNFNDLHQKISTIIDEYNLSKSYNYGYPAYGCDSSKGLGSYNKDKYLSLREKYNSTKSLNEKTIMLLVLVMYSFNNQIRFNSTGKFNLPVGKRDYNGMIRRNLASFNSISNIKDIVFKVDDFRALSKMRFEDEDFVYLDPPYLLGHASYNEKNGWTDDDEIELYNTLNLLNGYKVRFAISNVLEHKGKTNKILREWVLKNGYKLHRLEFTYNNSNYQSKAKENTTIEVLVTNY